MNPTWAVSIIRYMWVQEGWFSVDARASGSRRIRYTTQAPQVARMAPSAVTSTGLPVITPVRAPRGRSNQGSTKDGEIIHAASRCERITVVYVNNGVFGATGGQQAPTTPLGQRTTSYPDGRDPRVSGYPLRMAEMLAMVSPDSYIARCSVHDVRHTLTRQHLGAAFHLGLAPHPEKNQPCANLPMAKQTIDILSMLEEKTRGNLDADEAAMLKNILYDLRILFVKEKG